MISGNPHHMSDHVIRDRGREHMIRVTGEDKLGMNLETAAYNHAIDQAIVKGISRFWTNPSFRRLYAGKVRSLAFNLSNPKNPALLERVRTGSLSPQKLVKMTAIEMFPSNWEKELAIVANRHIRQQIATHDVPDGVFQCKKCKSWKTVYYQLQTRSADEPMTTFVTCAGCATHWKF